MYRSLIFILFFFTRFIFGQDYPCQVMVNMSPPYPITMSGYGSSIQEKINLTLLLGDISESGREVGLKFYIEGSSGFRAGSGDIVTGTSPLVLEGGVPLYLTQSDLSPYFRFENLQGLNPQAYGALLPEGMYQFCFEVYDWQSKRVISARSCAGAQLQGNSPPVLNLPSRGEYVVQQEPQNLIFQWSPMHINVPNVEYEFTLVELWDTGMDPGAAFLSGRPLYQVTTLSPTLLYGPSEPALLQGRNYAWRVRAVVWDGAEEADYFYNKGYSETFHFSYASPCSPPSGLRDASNNSSMSHKLNWFKTHQRYHVQYRKKNPAADAWFEVGPLSTHLREDDIDEELILYNLEGGKTYEYRVGGSCVGTGNRGGYVYSDIHEFTTRSRDSTGTYNCGEISGVELKGEAPLERLGSNEVFTAGDYPVTAKEVYGGQGSYTGWGYMPIPYLRDTKIKVYFEGIRINSNHQLMEGVLKTEYDEEWEGVMQGLNVEFPEEEQAETEAEAQAVVNSTATVTGSETGTTTEAGEEDEPMAYEEDPYELFEDITEEETTEETTAETQAGTSGANDAANSATSGQETGNIDTPLQVQDNQLPDDQILASTAPGDEKLIDDSGKIYNRDDVISIDCNLDGFKTMMLIRDTSGSSVSDVVWELTNMNNTLVDKVVTPPGNVLYKLEYSRLRSWGMSPGDIYELKADFGSGNIIVFIECVPPDEKEQDDAPVLDPMVIEYQGGHYQQEEIISIDCNRDFHVFELLNHEQYGVGWINWELASVNGVTLYKTEYGTESKYTLDQMQLFWALGEFPEGIFQLKVHYNYTSFMVYIECRDDGELDPLLIAQNTSAGNSDATTDTPAYLDEELDSVYLLVENYEVEFYNDGVVPFNFRDSQYYFQLRGLPDDIKSFTWELRSLDGILYDSVTSEHSSYTLDLYAVFDEYPEQGDLFKLMVYYGGKTFKVDLEFTFENITLSISDIIDLPYNEMLEHLLTSEEDRLFIANNSQYINSLQNRLNNNEFGYVAGLLMLEIPEEVNEKERAKLQTLNVLGALLSNKSVARSLLDERLKVVIIPRNKALTDIEPFASIPSLEGEYKKYRGLFTNWDGYKVFVGEEDILGGDCTAQGLKDKPRKPGQSILVHEMAHAVHHLAISIEESNIISSAYYYNKLDYEASTMCGYYWIVGNQENPYSSVNEREFFARLSEVYLGVSKSESPTGLVGKEAVIESQPAVYEILRRLYGEITLKGVVAP